jgi:hypothetical protein
MTYTITYDPLTGDTTIDDTMIKTTIQDTRNISTGIYPLYNYPGGYITLSQDGSSQINQNPSRTYGRDGTSPGAVYVGDVTVT